MSAHPNTRYFLREGEHPLRYTPHMRLYLRSPKKIPTILRRRSSAKRQLAKLRSFLRQVRESILREVPAVELMLGEIAEMQADAIMIVTLPANERGCAACKRMGIPYEQAIPSPRSWARRKRKRARKITSVLEQTELQFSP